jgi:hypothetical protein
VLFVDRFSNPMARRTAPAVLNATKPSTDGAGSGHAFSHKPGGLRLFPTLFEITLIGTATPAEYLEKKNDPNNVPPLPAHYLSAAQGGVSPHGGRAHGSRRKNRRLRRVRRQLALPRPGAAAGVAAAGADRQGALIWLAQQASGCRDFRLGFPPAALQRPYSRATHDPNLYRAPEPTALSAPHVGQVQLPNSIGRQ